MELAFFDINHNDKTLLGTERKFQGEELKTCGQKAGTNIAQVV